MNIPGAGQTRPRVRRVGLAWLLGWSILAALPPAGHTDGTDAEDGDPPEIPEPVRASIRLGQRWLANQQMADGSWPGGTGPAALATLALMVDGSAPGIGPIRWMPSRKTSSSRFAISPCLTSLTPMTTRRR